LPIPEALFLALVIAGGVFNAMIPILDTGVSSLRSATAGMPQQRRRLVRRVATDQSPAGLLAADEVAAAYRYAYALVTTARWMLLTNVTNGVVLALVIFVRYGPSGQAGVSSTDAYSQPCS
jgi:hypothetical protein